VAAIPFKRVIQLAEVIPFRGLRYNQELVPELSLVVSPPYDVISPRAQLRYHKKHPENAIHLDYGLVKPSDSKNNNRYTRAAATLKAWIDKKILIPEPKPALYFLREEYLAPDGSPAVREGFIAAIRLSDFSEGKIIPHEETAAAPKEDRLQLLKTTEANLSPIFCLYPDPENFIATRAAGLIGDPAIFLTDEAGTRHSVWVIDDPEETAALCDALSEKTFLIADGHHRYETMLAYRNARRAMENTPGDQPYDFTMAYLTSMDADNRFILPIHRFISGIPEEDLKDAVSLLERDFLIQTVPGTGSQRQYNMAKMMDELNGKRNVLGMYLAGDDSYRILVARRPRPMISSKECRYSAAFRSLDVAVLDIIVLARVLDIRPGGSHQSAKVKFIERSEAAFKKINKGLHNTQIAFFVNPTTMEEIKAVAEAGEKMPQKSTYFYPKPLTGLVFRSFYIQ